MKKAKKQVKSLIETSFLASAGSLGLGALGATQGQQGISNMMRFAPVMGRFVGVGMLTRQVSKMNTYKKKRRSKK